MRAFAWVTWTMVAVQVANIVISATGVLYGDGAPNWALLGGMTLVTIVAALFTTQLYRESRALNRWRDAELEETNRFNREHGLRELPRKGYVGGYTVELPPGYRWDDEIEDED